MKYLIFFILLFGCQNDFNENDALLKARSWAQARHINSDNIVCSIRKGLYYPVCAVCDINTGTSIISLRCQNDTGCIIRVGPND